MSGVNYDTAALVDDLAFILMPSEFLGIVFRFFTVGTAADLEAIKACVDSGSKLLRSGSAPSAFLFTVTVELSDPSPAPAADVEGTGTFENTSLTNLSSSSSASILCYPPAAHGLKKSGRAGKGHPGSPPTR